MNDILITVEIILLLTLFFLYLFSIGGIDRDSEFHVHGPGDVHCPTCNGTCREYYDPQSQLSDFDE